MIAGIETGGTKVLCALAEPSAPARPVRSARIPTTSPEQTLGRVRAFLAEHAGGRLEAVGLASFGPVRTDPRDPRRGSIAATPKPGWSGTDLLTGLGLGAVPTAVVSDVTGAAVGEHRLGAGRGVRDLAYVTVGTGVGLGLLVDGRPLSERAHPEAGHLLVRRHPQDRFPGSCRFHGDCLEGLAAGPAVAARWGRPAEDLGPHRERAVELGAWYTAQLLAAVTWTVMPERIVLGGGVAGAEGLLGAAREQLAGLVGGALEGHPAGDPRSGYVVPPGLGTGSGVLGALALARDLLD
ncbi:ROK family protein [Kocuria flava]|uniref:ROK family protein n=1 Tax=Kocuria flava TaxID=446860 RepID=UPI001FF54795|nr:ROK family protein [Kocuria flava]MCJ8504568.1 ROK family protein [Kocuria flava]